MYKNIISKIIVNGALTGEINIQRSVRQGCPLSMLLYVIAIESLNININNNTNIQGIKIPNMKRNFKTITCR